MGPGAVIGRFAAVARFPVDDIAIQAQALPCVIDARAWRHAWHATAASCWRAGCRRARQAEPAHPEAATGSRCASSNAPMRRATVPARRARQRRSRVRPDRRADAARLPHAGPRGRAHRESREMHGQRRQRRCARIARVTRVVVRFVVDPCQIALRRIALELRTQQYRNSGRTRSTPSGVTRRHGGQPRDPRAAQQLQQYGLGSVVRMLCEPQRAAPWRSHLVERRIAPLARRCLDTEPLSRGTSTRIDSNATPEACGARLGVRNPRVGISHSP